MISKTVTPPTFKCMIFGEEPVALLCAKELLARGHEVIAFVTKSPDIRVWANKHNIIVLKHSEYCIWSETHSIDVIFSITFPVLIPPEVYKRAKITALNYHDGPLPPYAGLNCSSWAIYNQEVKHAIIWHCINSHFNDGEIAIHKDFALESSETALSLNMKSSALAFESFKDIIVDLENDKLTVTAQDPDVEQILYSHFDRPPAFCTVNWNNTANSIDSLVRSCNFGHFTNRFGSAKITHEYKTVLLIGTNIDNSVVIKAVQPGTVLKISPFTISIACSDGVISLIKISSLTGIPMTISEAVKELGIIEGQILSSDGFDTLSELSPAVAEYEPFFVNALASREVPSIPYKEPGDKREPLIISIALPELFKKCYSDDLPTATSAVFFLVLSSLLRQDFFTIAMSYPNLQSDSSTHLINNAVPLNLEIEATDNFTTFVASLNEKCEVLSSSPGFLLDLIARHPNLRSQSDLSQGIVSTIALVSQKATLPTGAKLALFVNSSDFSLITDGSISLSDLQDLAKRIYTVAGTVSENPSRAIKTIDCLTSEERDTILRKWNDTKKSFPEKIRIFDKFEQQVKIQPDATALVYGKESMSFVELEQAANRIANIIQGFGIKPGKFVGLLVERGFDLVISLIGIAKSGAAYVPVDSTYPDERILFLLEDTDCELVITSQSLIKHCDSKRRMVTVDGPEVAHASTEQINCLALSSDICYSIYTSGSTGQPKGVVLTHKAVVNTLDWVNRTFEVTSNDRILFVTSPSFDLSVYDVFGILGAGASIEIASMELLDEPEILVNHLCESEVTIWDSAPPALAQLAPFFPERAVSSKLRLVMLSGDWIPVGLPGHLMSVFPKIKVKSLGGATEAAIWSNYFHIDEVNNKWSSIPYGYPIQNARYYILDQHLRPLPSGYTGELYIGGTCLAKGYLNRPKLTAERFLSDPFISGERIYKTGDLARFWLDSTMEFLGRADFQVKIRGFRVELGEVESAICSLPKVENALCTAHQDATGNNGLIAYIVANDQIALNTQNIKHALEEKLPSYMVPTLIIVLTAFPLTSNGKVDRKRLPSPEQYQPKSEYVKPTSQLEHKLVRIWEKLMARKNIGIDDNFFEIGGHSLMAVTLVLEIKNQLNEKVSLTSILENPTIRSLAMRIKSTNDKFHTDKLSMQVDTVHKLRAGGSRTFFFIYDGEGEILLYRNLANRLPDDFTIFGILPQTKPGIPLAHLSIEDMASSCVKQMKQYQTEGPYYLGGLCAGAVISYEIAAQLERDVHSIGGLFLLEGVEPSTAPRKGLMTKRRLTRLHKLFIGGKGESKTEGELTNSEHKLWNEAIRRLFRATKYELLSRMVAVTVSIRLRFLIKILKKDKSWSSWIPTLGVRDIFVYVQKKYETPAINSDNVILVRCKMAVPGVKGDEPMGNLFQGKLLGWEPYVKSGLHLLTVSGGHSSMLQEPFVDDISKQLTPFLEEKI